MLTVAFFRTFVLGHLVIEIGGQLTFFVLGGRDGTLRLQDNQIQEILNAADRPVFLRAIDPLANFCPVVFLRVILTIPVRQRVELRGKDLL